MMPTYGVGGSAGGRGGGMGGGGAGGRGLRGEGGGGVVPNFGEWRDDGDDDEVVFYRNMAHHRLELERARRRAAAAAAAAAAGAAGGAGGVGAGGAGATAAFPLHAPLAHFSSCLPLPPSPHLHASHASTISMCWMFPLRWMFPIAIPAPCVPCAIRADELGVDLEELLLMEAIWLSLQVRLASSAALCPDATCCGALLFLPFLGVDLEEQLLFMASICLSLPTCPFPLDPASGSRRGSSPHIRFIFNTSDYWGPSRASAAAAAQQQEGMQRQQDNSHDEEVIESFLMRGIGGGGEGGLGDGSESTTRAAVGAAGGGGGEAGAAGEQGGVPLVVPDDFEGQMRLALALSLLEAEQAAAASRGE
ncbi:unnamed protein product [Closterium sp. Naga37s-1]|nr:unnamed protein product [Closterium sp. Naga37s-1]